MPIMATAHAMHGCLASNLDINSRLVAVYRVLRLYLCVVSC